MLGALLLLATAVLCAEARRTVYARDQDSLKNALKYAKAGDDIVVVGVIRGSNFVSKSRDGTSSNRITIRGQSPGDGMMASKKYSGYCLQLWYSDYWDVKDLFCSGFKKGIVIDAADHGTITNVQVTRVGTEAFKFRYGSQYWDVQNCWADNCGLLKSDYGEGFYVGNAYSNWKGSTTPDKSGYISFYKCRTTNTVNDGWDIKEGAHHVKVIASTVDFTEDTHPKAGASRGYSSVYMRGDYIQVINPAWKDKASGLIGWKMYTETKNSWKACGNNQEVYGAEAWNPSGAYMFSTSTKGGLTKKYIYGYTENTKGGGIYQSSTRPSSKDPSSFSEMTWKGEGGKARGTGVTAPTTLVEPTEEEIQMMSKDPALDPGDHSCLEGRINVDVCCPMSGPCNREAIRNSGASCITNQAPCLLHESEWEPEDDSQVHWIIAACSAAGVAVALIGLFAWRRTRNGESLEYNEMTSTEETL
eukprot:TRINITY_DN48087_c0_g1_i1.p2 TRINITY_DN48087_c0_g1~~TRINITY_DN48087_c0_g1_i1.p2  ORF type:complete len:473 (+),score=35.48 TRINITY_DN48087_c0_g1_i1:34-1452(+)